MFKIRPRNILFILIINYLLIIIFSATSEFIFINNKAARVQSLVSLAADMAIEQAQTNDDFFKPGEGYQLDSDTKAYTIKTPHVSGDGYIEVNALETMTQRNSKEDIFEYLFVSDDQGNSRTKEFLTKNSNVLDIESSVAYWQEGFGNVRWYKVPKIAQLGFPATGSSVVKAYSDRDQLINTGVVKNMFEMYELHKSKKVAYSGSGQPLEYYMTPMNLGITYIDEELLRYYYMNNLELLMRAKYIKNGVSLKDEEGGNGILKGQTYTDLVSNDLLMNANPINDGSFTLLRGEEVVNPFNGAQLYKGIKPQIRYKVIDMFDSRNDELLSLAFGARPTVGGSKAEYFKSLSEDVIDPMTGRPYETKPIVVAEVTFYADVIIPFSTLGVREMRAKENPDNTLEGRYLFDLEERTPSRDNYIDLVRTRTSGLNGGLGNQSDLMVYKKIFAIAP